MGRETTTIRVSRPTKSELDELKEAEGLATQDAAVRFLLHEWDMKQLQELVEDQSVDLSEADESDDAVTVRTVDTEGQPPMQPLAVATLPSVEVYCPACGDVLLTYELSEETPVVPGGPFGDLTTGCESCGSGRDAHTLVAARPAHEVDPAVVRRGLTAYWDSEVFAGDVDDPAARARYCLDLVRDANWNWRPPLSAWLAVSDMESIVSEVATVLGNVVGAGLSVGRPGDDCCPTDDWHLHVPRDADVDAGREWLRDWLGDPVAVETVDSPDSSRVSLALAGLDEAR